MENILDLSCFLEKTLTVKVSPTRTVNLPKPTQAVVIQIIGLSSKDADKMTTEEQLEDINKLIYTILNSNTQLYKFSVSDVENMPLQAKMALIDAYNKFALELVNNPN